MAKYMVMGALIMGVYEGVGELPPNWVVLDGPNAPFNELFYEGGEIQQRPTRPSLEHFWGEEGWIIPSGEDVDQGENWQGLETDLRGSEAWAQVYRASKKSIGANTAFTLLYGTLTRTYNLEDLKMAIADIRLEMRETEVGDFSPESLEWLKERLSANNFDPDEFDLDVGS